MTSIIQPSRSVKMVKKFFEILVSEVAYIEILFMTEQIEKFGHCDLLKCDVLY
jgi:hypothetical protein